MADTILPVEPVFEDAPFHSRKFGCQKKLAVHLELVL